jgi:hypothetical protein
MNAIEQAAKEINDKIDYIVRVQTDTNRRRENAEEHGRELAKMVAHFLDHPEDVGRDALRRALDIFYGGSSGSFHQSVGEVIGSLAQREVAPA